MEDRYNYDEVVKKEWRRLFGLAYRLCGNTEEAKDIVQETFTRGLEHLDRFEGRSQLSTYLYRIAFNVWKNMLRRKSVRRILSLSAAAEGREIDPPDPSPSPAASAEREERIGLVHRGLERLPPAERFIVVLRDIEEKTYEEIAEILGCRLGTVKSKLARARDRLRVELLPFLERLS